LEEADMANQKERRIIRNLRFGAATSGYILLAASAVFLMNVIYQSIQAQVFDGVVAAMVGVVAVYCMVAFTLIAAFSRHGDAESSATSTVQAREPNLRLLEFDPPPTSARQDDHSSSPGIEAGGSSRAA
jgi:Na+/melibiose symporter-like transporter